jgi:hypothetical protein
MILNFSVSTEYFEQKREGKEQNVENEGLTGYQGKKKPDDDRLVEPSCE